MIEPIIIVILLGVIWLVIGDMKIDVRQPLRRASDYLGPVFDTYDRTETMFDRRRKHND
jgi:hypothetical protein